MRWSSNFAYCIGLITTDGSLSKDGRHIAFVSKDLEIIRKFAQALNLKNTISKKRSGYTNRKMYSILQFGNVRLYRFLLSIGLCPNKTKRLKKLLIPDKYFADFLRGHLDGDGYTYSYWDKRWKSSFMLYTGFTSASVDHLSWIKHTTERLYKIKGKIKDAGKSTYQLIYAKHASISLLARLYYKRDLISLSRKRFKIDRALGIIRKQAGMLESVDRLS